VGPTGLCRVSPAATDAGSTAGFSTVSTGIGYDQTSLINDGIDELIGY